MKRLYVAVDEVHQVFSPKTGRMSTSLVIDVFGYPVEVPVSDPVIRGVIDAAVAQMGDPMAEVEQPEPAIPQTEVTPALHSVFPDPTIPKPGGPLNSPEPKVPAPTVVQPVFDDDDGFEAG